MSISKIKQNPVRDYRSVEEGYTTPPCMPLGMQPIFRNVVAFLRNAGGLCKKEEFLHQMQYFVLSAIQAAYAFNGTLPNVH